MERALLDTYLTTVLRIYDEDYATITELRPSQAGDTSTTTLRPVHLIGVWNPGGEPTDAGANIAHRERMENHALAAAGRFIVGSASSPGYEWAEEVLVITDIDDEAAAQLARMSGQPAFWHWDGLTLRVLDSVVGQEIGRTPATAHELTHRPCPMQPADITTREVCERPGGPWVRRSMEVAAFFERDRASLLSAVGCDVCHGGRIRSAPGRPILLDLWSTASRYAAAQILRPTTSEDLL